MSQKPSRKCVQIISKIATGLVIISIVWGLLLASLGFMNLLPLKVNWPVGYTSKALQIGNNYAVPVEFVSRVQLYDSELNFKKAVWVNSEGGIIHLYPYDENSFWVYTVRENHKIRVNLSGDKIQNEKYEQLPTAEVNYSELNIPTSSFLLIISNFGYLWSIAMISALIIFFADRKAKKRQ